MRQGYLYRSALLLGALWLAGGSGISAATTDRVERGAADANATDPLDAAIAAFVSEPAEIECLLAQFEEQASELHASLRQVQEVEWAAIRDLLRRQVLANLEAKRELGGPVGRSFPLSAEELRRTVIEYEAFKADAYVRSGVFPKRYFGYFDRKWDTAEHEVTLARTVHRAVEVINRYLNEEGSPLAITDLEVAVTWIAEGGALLLGERQDLLETVNPTADVGLDDIVLGLSDLADLRDRLDAELGTGLGNLVGESEDGLRHVRRPMTFVESLVGTALMWLWEKKIAQRKLAEEGRELLPARSLDEQFVLTSLVYNSGLIHDPGREREILAFDQGAKLFRISENNAHRRPRLDLVPPPATLEELLAGRGYRQQPTSWLAVYHILQRYGAYLALRRFTDFFDEAGRFRLAERD